MNAAQSFHCPTCGAPLDYDGGESLTIQCPYCGTSVVVPETLRAEKKTVAPSFTALPAFQGYDPILLAGIAGQVSQLVQSGNKIEAIKLFRQTFSVGLKEAKDAVERLEAGSGLASVTVVTGGEAHPVTVTTTHRGAVTTIQGRQVAKAAAGAAGMAGCFVVALVIGILLITLIPILFAFAQPGGPLAGVWAQVNPMGYGRVSLSFGQEGTGQGMFQDPRAIALDADGNIYIGDFDGGRVQVFGPDGRFRALWPGGEDRYLQAIEVGPDGIVYMVYGGDIHRYEAATGKLLGIVEFQEDWYFDDLTTAPDGGLVAIVQNETVVRFDAALQPTLVIPSAVSSVSGDSELNCRVAVDGLGNIYVMGSFNNGVFQYSPDGRFLTRFGSQGDQPGQFRAMNAIAVDGFGRVFVSDILGIQVFDAGGRYLNRIRLPQGVAFGLVFNQANELFAVTNEPKVLKYTVQKP